MCYLKVALPFLMIVIMVGCSSSAPVTQPTVVPDLEATVQAMVATQVAESMNTSSVNPAPSPEAELLYPDRSSIRDDDVERAGNPLRSTAQYIHGEITDGIFFELRGIDQSDSVLWTAGVDIWDSDDTAAAARDGRMWKVEAPDGKAFFHFSLNIRNYSDQSVSGQFWPFVQVQLETPLGTIEEPNPWWSQFGEYDTSESTVFLSTKDEAVLSLEPGEAMTAGFSIQAANVPGTYYVYVGTSGYRIVEEDRFTDVIPRWVWAFTHDGLTDR